MIKWSDDLYNKLLSIFKRYRKFTPKMQKQLNDLGFMTTYNCSHVRLIFYVNNKKCNVIISHTPSDLHSGRQAVREIRRVCLKEEGNVI